MAASQPLLEGVIRAQTANSTLSGDELKRAARRLVALGSPGKWSVRAVDAAGERIIGAALALSDSLHLIDKSRRLDGMSVLLVSGHTAGTAALATAAGMAIAMGADHVEGVVLGKVPGQIEGCDRVISLTEEPRLIAL